MCRVIDAIMVLEISQTVIPYVGFNASPMIITLRIEAGVDNLPCTLTFIAFDWNGQLLVKDNGELSSESNVMIVPGRGVGKKEDVVIVVMPHFLQPPVATTAVPPLPFPPAIPIDGVHGGAIVGGAGEGGLFVPCKFSQPSIYVTSHLL